MSFLRPTLLSTAMLLPACLVDGDSDPQPLDELVDAQDRCLGCGWGPPVTNSHGLNGLDVSALDTTGQFHDGWRLTSVEVVGDRLSYRLVEDVHAEDGVLHGTDASGTEVSGAEFVDSRWWVELEATGDKTLMQVVSFVDDPSASRYTFIASDPSTGILDPKLYTCPEDPDTGEYSVVLFTDLDVDPGSGTHFARPNTIYFGCTSAAVGKAAMWGYSPWAAGEDTHQTASRTVRADYCGDGTPYTIQGTPLQVTDTMGIHGLTDPTKETEAMWGPSGAVCIKVPRLGYDPATILCNGATLPFCSVDDTLDDWPGASLWTKNW